MLGFGPLGKFALGQASSPVSVGGQPFAEPVRSRIAPRLAIALIASGVIGPVLNPDTQITQKFESKWHQPWSEPVRFKTSPRLQIALDASGQFAPVLNDKQLTDKFESRWHYPWSEPVRIKPQLRTGDQPFFFFQPTPVVSFSYYDWLTEPVRLKPGLRSPLQQFLTQDTQWIPTPVKFEEGWFNWLTEPVRLPTGLKAWLQQTIAYHPRILPNPNVTLTLAATETNNDIALFGLVTYNQADKAIVSIKEIPATNAGAASIEET